MSKLLLQRLMLVLGVIALIVVLIDLGISIAATIPSTTPARVEQVKAGPYQLTVSLYRYPASAGYGLPFAVAPSSATSGSPTYQVYSVPGSGVDATPVRATFSPDPNVHNGIKGAAEITVQGPWTLQITVNGSQGQSVAIVSFPATTLPAIPIWLGWLVGFLPFYILGGFFLMQMSRRKNEEANLDTVSPHPTIQM
ncbi:hypothetical protein [Dictyobacter arantiisoli]|uniref:Uncharacterized protein n=1 Tax=Dictyobacter arantiisoli TaxID=2014874 RepID=A0A5A5TF73_9CHLR|nr:hypothetical protein [Dictyobacter arantiisoli]GCF09796.1 hypothetical protein KDI_33600 [Dictyobacter arantiisoli]